MYKKTVNGKVYWYLREMARVDGKPKMVSERYLGSAKDIEKLLDAKEAVSVPEKTRHLGFGDSAAVWASWAGWMLPGSSIRSWAPDARTPGPPWAPTWHWRR